MNNTKGERRARELSAADRARIEGDEPLPEMDRVSKARANRFVKRACMTIKRSFLKDIVKRQRKIRNAFKESNKSNDLLEKDTSFVELEAEHKLVEKLNIDVLGQLAWQRYYDKQKNLTFPARIKLTDKHQKYIRRGVDNSIMKETFAQLIQTHLIGLKKEAKKLAKARKRDEKKMKASQTVESSADAPSTSTDNDADSAVSDEAVDQLAALLGEAEDAEDAQQTENAESPVESAPIASTKKAKKFDADRLRIGQICECIVDKVESFGLFVTFWRASEEIRGMLHVSQLSDKFTADPSDKFRMGDKVRAVIIAVDPVTHKVELSLKPSYFPAGETPLVEHLGDKVRANVLAERARQRRAHGMDDGIGTGMGPEDVNHLDFEGLSSVFLDRIKSKMTLDETALSKIKQFYALANGAKHGRNRLGQKKRRELAEQVLGIQAQSSQPARAPREPSKRRMDDRDSSFAMPNSKRPRRSDSLSHR